MKCNAFSLGYNNIPSMLPLKVRYKRPWPFCFYLTSSHFNSRHMVGLYCMRTFYLFHILQWSNSFRVTLILNSWIPMTLTLNVYTTDIGLYRSRVVQTSSTWGFSVYSVWETSESVNKRFLLLEDRMLTSVPSPTMITMATERTAMKISCALL